MESDQAIETPPSDPSLPEYTHGGHGTAEYILIQDFLAAWSAGRSGIDEIRAMEMTAPGIVAHELPMRGGAWLDGTQLRLSGPAGSDADKKSALLLAAEAHAGWRR